MAWGTPNGRPPAHPTRAKTGKRIQIRLPEDVLAIVEAEYARLRAAGKRCDGLGDAVVSLLAQRGFLWQQDADTIETDEPPPPPTEPGQAWKAFRRDRPVPLNLRRRIDPKEAIRQALRAAKELSQE